MATVTVSATGGNWSSIATWVGGALPLTGDDIVANATSGPLTVDSNRTCLTINFTGYTNTFTINNGIILTVTGTAVTLASGMTYNNTTTGILSVTGTKTITFAGITIPRLTIANAQTLTISGINPTVSRLVVNATSNLVLAGTSLEIDTSLTSSSNISGTSLTFKGAVTYSNSGYIAGFTVLTGATLTLSSNVNIASGTITFEAGTTLTPGSTLLYIAGNITLNTSPVTWNNIEIAPTGYSNQGYTITLSSNWNVGGNFVNCLQGLNYGYSVINSNNIYVSGNFSTGISGYNGIYGNTTLNLIGTSKTIVNGSAIGVNTNITGSYSATDFSFGGGGVLNCSSGTLTHTGTLSVQSCTLTLGSNNLNNFTILASGLSNSPFTVTLSANTYINGNISIGPGGGYGPAIINGFNLYVAGNFTIGSSGFNTVSGSTIIRLTGASKTISGTSYIISTMYVTGSYSVVDFSLANLFDCSGGTLNHTGTLSVSNCTLTLGSNTLKNLTIAGSGNSGTPYTLTLTAPTTITGNLFTNSNNFYGPNIISGNTLFVGGDLRRGISGFSSLTGTSGGNIVLNGTGLWYASGGGDPYGIPITINTSGTISLQNGTIGFTGGTLTHTSGIISPGATSTFSTGAGTTYNINSSGFNLTNWTPATGTHTINTSTITVNNNLTLAGNTTFAGTAGWTVANLTDNTAGRILELKDGPTYTITSSVSLTGINATRWTIRSSNASVRANFVLGPLASQSFIYVDATRLNSSAGATCYTLGGTISTTPVGAETLNWNPGTRPAPFNTITMA